MYFWVRVLLNAFVLKSFFFHKEITIDARKSVRFEEQSLEQRVGNSINFML